MKKYKMVPSNEQPVPSNEQPVPSDGGIIPIIVSTHGNFIVDKNSNLQIIDYNNLLPSGFSDSSLTIWTWTFMPLLGNPATHIKETMDLMYLSRDFFLQLFSLNLEDGYFTHYIQEAQYIVSRNYMSIMIPQIYTSLKQTYDALWFNIYKELFYDATRGKNTIEINRDDLLQIAGDIRNNSEKLKDFLNNLLAFQNSAVVNNLMWLVKTDRDRLNRKVLLKDFTTASGLLAQKQEEQYTGSGQDPWDITMTYQGENTALFGDIENGQQNKKGKKIAETHHHISNQELIKQVISTYPDVKNILIIDASCAHLQKINKNAVVDRFIIDREQKLIDELFPNKITMTEENAIKIAEFVKVMLKELKFSSLLEDCNNILKSISHLGSVIPTIKEQMITTLGKQLTQSNIKSMTYFNENSILFKKTLKEILKPYKLKRFNSVDVRSSEPISNVSNVSKVYIKRKALTMPSERELLSSIAGVDVISEVGVRMTENKLKEILESARLHRASDVNTATADVSAADADVDAAIDEDHGGSRRKSLRRRKNASKKSMKRKKNRSKQSTKRSTKRRLKRRRITRKRV
jgi:hypothetical protein